MCNCFSPTFLAGFSTCSFGLTSSKTLLIHGFRNLEHTNNRVQFASDSWKQKRNLPKSSSSDFSDDLWLKDSENAEIPVSSAPRIDEKYSDRDVGFLEFNNNQGGEAEAELIKSGAKSDSELGKGIVRRGRQMMKRSSMIAKQVISVHTALSLGFVAQLWVDISSWIVYLVEVRPSLLSGEVEKFLLEDVKQVGDVVLVEDESVMDNEFKLFGLQTLVGYNVVTPGQRNLGKVRGYNFSINSGAVESLELDCLGISIIPSGLVSTYCLFVEDVVDIFSDTIVVQEAAVSRLQRLTKGLWDSQKTAYSEDEIEDYGDLTNSRTKPKYGRSRKKSSGKKLRKKMKEIADEWDLPMDFF